MQVDSPNARYLTALSQHNSLLSDYIIQYKAADPMTQQKWKEEVTPIFIAVGSALDIWGVAIHTQDSSYEQEQAFIKLRKQIFVLLFKYGIVEVKDGTN
jgi:hypothetical protein